MTLFLRHNIEKKFRMCGSQQSRPFLYEGNRLISSFVLYWSGSTQACIVLPSRWQPWSYSETFRGFTQSVWPFPISSHNRFLPIFASLTVYFSFVLSNSSGRYSVTQWPMPRQTALSVNHSSASGMLTNCVSWSVSLWQFAAGSPISITSESLTFHFVSVVITTQYFVQKR